jgi:DNA-binding NarL/FixJ family response regulator
MTAILLVDDEPVASQMLTLGLERLGYAVTACPHGLAALEVIDGDFQVIVTDLVMPQVDGLGLLRILVERKHPALRVVITSFADKSSAVEALNLGVHHLLEKPFSVADLHQVLQRVLRAGTGSVEDIFRRHLAALPLTERERHIIVFVLKGLSNADIARLHGTSEQSVKSSLYALYRKLGIGSRGELFHLLFPI